MANIQISEPLGARQAALPLLVGGAGAQLVIPEAADGALRIEAQAAQYWLRTVEASGATLNGMPLHGDVALNDGDVITLGAAQLTFGLQHGAASLEVWHAVGNATIAPLLQEQLPGEEVAAGVREIIAAGDDPSGANATAPLVVTRGVRSVRMLGIVAAVLGVALLASLFAFVSVGFQVTPDTATVDVSGLHLRAGEQLFLLPGRHVATATRAGYRDGRIEFDVKRGDQDPAWRIDLALLPGVLSVDTGGIEAQVLVDGDIVGRAPGKVQAPAGQHDIIVRAPRYVDLVTAVNVAGAGKEQALSAKLQPAFGWLVLATVPAGASVTVDGKDLGVAPLKLELDSGLRELVLNAPGRRAWHSQVAITAGQTLDLGVVDLAVPATVTRAAMISTPGSPGAAAAPGSESAAGSAPPAAVPAPPASRIQSPLLGTLVLLPAGQFTEGSERREQGRRSNETLRKVTLSRPFYMAENEVSNAQFHTFRSTHVSGIAWSRTLDLDKQAVSSVSWEDAVEFCNWLSQREGLPVAYERREGRWQLVMPYNHGYRLPTEAEWEYAARYVDGRRWNRYGWGDAAPPPESTANIAGKEYTPGPEVRDADTLPGYQDEHVVVAPVGSYGRAASGLADMGGNVSEWMHDVYVSLPDNIAVTDPRGPDTAGAHVVRGANWRTAAIAELRLAWRDRAAGPSQTLGFRVARSVEAPP